MQYADPIQQFHPKSNDYGMDASTPTDIQKPKDQDNLIWSCARDGKLRMVSK